MRYTTIIDLRDYPALYRNINVRLLYLHLVLASGYHDDDKDKVQTSVRRLAYDCHITISAARNALRQLSREGLLKVEDGTYIVTKWTPQKPITPRAKTQDEQQRREAAQAATEARRKKEEKEEEQSRKVNAWRDYLVKNNLTPQEYVQIDTKHKAGQGDAEAIATCNARGWSYSPTEDRMQIYRDLQLSKAAAGNKAAADICAQRNWSAAANT